MITLEAISKNGKKYLELNVPGRGPILLDGSRFHVAIANGKYEIIPITNEGDNDLGREGTYGSITG